uniref:Uncharacterized protein n=1 Tax=Parastrongyloides trichosuri TaxID=131310 RepID=A0A0N4Z2S0_PARTI
MSDSDESVSECSFDNTQVETKPHTASMSFSAGSERAARIIYSSLIVDKEPLRSKTKRDVKLEGNCIKAIFESTCEKSVAKSEAHFLHLNLLAKSMIDAIDNYNLDSNENFCSDDESKSKKARLSESKED